MERWTMRVAVLGLAGVLAGCAAVAGPPAGEVAALRFIGEQRMPWKMAFQGTTVGGLSGVDYDAAAGDWILASDDRSGADPARYYRAALRFTATSFDAVTLAGVRLFRQGDGTTYPGARQGVQAGGVVPDIESARVDPRDGTIWYTSEGDVRIGLDPFVRQAGADGALRGELPLPAMLREWPGKERGVRNNANLEGLSFAPDGASLWLALEAPLEEDGEPPTPEHGALARITQLDRGGRVLGQYAYPLDAIPARPGEGKFADNGISEIVATGPGTLLVLERSAVQGADGRYRNHIRLYEADLRGASDIAAVPALARVALAANNANADAAKEAPRGAATGAAAIAPAAKRLVLDFNTLGLPVLDNLEGFAFGPRLPNGHATLLFVSDDNFSKSQVTQLLLFEVLPVRPGQ
ncbi:esterase-like activity of phytase family protein [Pseudoduganella sp. SL102]|uniref:esterase-like activity of phytase family protein n=1 Tax=Pseudoduganella sp. SL102 TaxID=2995154 RepID=UPI00248CC839|nr:esterase-like activity of phytase family protein [Pseudoduganella sp. SL102]WBS00946.1 esterase-like activity of phytase family protein [Pseudoduganella sp. SL102]